MADLVVGVVGLGLGQRFVAALKGEPAVGRMVVADVDAGRVERARQEHPAVSAGYADLDTMLERERPDAVCVVTPDHLHRPHTLRCLGAGCHVLQTKPLATNLDDGRAIVRAAEASGAVFMVAHERRFRPRWRAAKALLERGELGQVVHIRAEQLGDRRGHFSRSPWYASPEAGRTALVGSGIHEVDLIRFLVGRPVLSVSGYSNRLGELEFPAAKTTTAVVQFAGHSADEAGAIGEVTVSYVTRWPEAGPLGERFRLVGTRGVMVGNRVARDGRPDWAALSAGPDGIEEGVRGAVQAFLRSIVDGAPVPVDGREAYASLAVAVAADRSAATGQKVEPQPLDA
jgi:predicted dehydrogenase